MKRALLAVLFVSALAGICGEAPLVLENQQLSLRFDPRTGNWIGLALRPSGEELVTGISPHAAVAPPKASKLDRASIDHAVASEQAISLAGEWLYTPAPPEGKAAAQIPNGRFEGITWASTPVPSRRGTGDDRLHNRTGEFWYRREFKVPADWNEAELGLVIGAVDDFDTTWLNGQRIGRTGVETPHHWETPRFYRFPPRLLRRDQTNTLVIRVTNPAFDGGIDGPIALGLATAFAPPAADAPPLTRHALTRKDGITRLEMTAPNGALEYRAEFTLKDDQSAFERQLTVKNTSSKEQLFQTAHYTTPPISIGTNQGVIFPGSLPWGDVKMESLLEDDAIRPRTEDPIVAVWDPVLRRGLGSWFHCEEEFTPVSVRRTSAGIAIRHSQGIIIRLQPGEEVALGKQHFWLAQGSRDVVLRGVLEVYRAISLRAPANRPSGLHAQAVYCGHPGGPPELNYLHYGGFKALERYVPTLRKMQIDLLWLLPTWEHGDGKKWNLYSPFDHFQVDHLLGTADDLKSLSRACATQDIHLMFDLVPHGPPDFTPLAKSHPEWIARREDGQHQIAWSQLAFDNNHPGWQDYMRRAAEWGAREFGAVGARVDCGAGGPLNWNRAVTSRPSLSSLAAGLGMNRAIREGYERVHQQAVVLPEEYTGANIFHRVGDLTYDSQFYYLQADLLERNAPPAEWAQAFQQFLHDQQQVLPPGALKLRWISNHDTVSWTFQKLRPAKAYGLERMRALLALCAFIEGVPMVYQGDEDPAVYGGKGEPSVKFLARVFGLRKQLPALRDGSANYEVARATEGVFACLRSRGKDRALVLISFNPTPVETTLSLPTGVGGPCTDRFSGESVKLDPATRLSMRPFQVRVLTFE